MTDSSWALREGKQGSLARRQDDALQRWPTHCLQRSHGVGNPSPTTIQPGMFPPAMPPPDSPPIAPYWDEGYNPVGLLATVFGAMFFGCPIAVSYGLLSRWILMRRLHRDGEPSIAKIVEKSQEYKAPNKNRRTSFWIYTVKVLMPAGDLMIEREDVVVDKELWDGVATSGSPRKGSSDNVDVFTAVPQGATLDMVYLPSEPCVCESADNAKPSAHKRGATGHCAHGRRGAGHGHRPLPRALPYYEVGVGARCLRRLPSRAGMLRALRCLLGENERRGAPHNPSAQAADQRNRRRRQAGQGCSRRHDGCRGRRTSKRVNRDEREEIESVQLLWLDAYASSWPHASVSP